MFLETSMISLKIIDSIPDIERKVNAAIAPLVNQRIKTNMVNIKNNIQGLTGDWITQQPEIQSLLSSSPLSLAGQFGIPPAQVPFAVSSIIESVKASIFPEFRPFDSQLKGGFVINLQPDDFNNLLSLVSGHVFYAKGDLHWLNWLLTLGSSIVVANYGYSASVGSGRSGLGVMSIGRSFRVPPRFSGTPDDNFITRALSGKSQQDQITKIIEKALI